MGAPLRVNLPNGRGDHAHPILSHTSRYLRHRLLDAVPKPDVRGGWGVGPNTLRARFTQTRCVIQYRKRIATIPHNTHDPSADRRLPPRLFHLSSRLPLHRRIFVAASERCVVEH
jgi:hypothetical protein